MMHLLDIEVTDELVEYFKAYGEKVSSDPYIRPEALASTMLMMGYLIRAEEDKCGLNIAASNQVKA